MYQIPVYKFQIFVYLTTNLYNEFQDFIQSFNFFSPNKKNRSNEFST